MKKIFEITDNEAYYVYDKLINFYDQFDNIENYSLIKKKESNNDFGDRLDLTGKPIYSDKLFSSYNIPPNDMEFELEVVTDKTNKLYNILLGLVSSHTNVSVPGRQLRILVWEKTTNTIVGFIRVNSPTLNMKPRSVIYDCNMSDKYKEINDNMVVGTIIVPTQPFGYNCLGGKLLALISNSNEVRNIFNKRYNTDIKYFETTSLYGSIKKTSQYDGLRPYIRNGGLTESKLIPIPTNEIVYSFYNLFKRFRIEGKLFGIGSGSVKLKILTKIYSLTLNKLKDIAPDKHTILKNRMKEKTENVTTKKLYYYSTYGVNNIKEFVVDDIDPKFNIDTERFDIDKMIDWWKFSVGLIGTVGVIWQMPATIGFWLVGLAFLVLFVNSFVEE